MSMTVVENLDGAVGVLTEGKKKGEPHTMVGLYYRLVSKDSHPKMLRFHGSILS